MTIAQSRPCPCQLGVPSSGVRPGPGQGQLSSTCPWPGSVIGAWARIGHCGLALAGRLDCDVGAPLGHPPLPICALTEVCDVTNLRVTASSQELDEGEKEAFKEETQKFCFWGDREDIAMCRQAGSQPSLPSMPKGVPPRAQRGTLCAHSYVCIGLHVLVRKYC
jgi:hypothetical protein